MFFYPGDIFLQAITKCNNLSLSVWCSMWCFVADTPLQNIFIDGSQLYLPIFLLYGAWSSAEIKVYSSSKHNYGHIRIAEDFPDCRSANVRLCQATVCSSFLIMQLCIDDTRLVGNAELEMRCPGRKGDSGPGSTGNLVGLVLVCRQGILPLPELSFIHSGSPSFERPGVVLYNRWDRARSSVG